MQHYYKNQEKIAIQKRQKYYGERELYLEYSKNYYNNNKSKAFAKSAKRRATKIQRTPPWLSEICLEEIKTIYKRAQLIKLFTGETWHVDHIIPLQGKTVSGLHVPWNLQILPAEDNLRKANKFTP